MPTDWSLAFGSVISIAVAVLYAYVGHRVGRRERAPASAMPLAAFVAWWHCLSASALAWGILGLSAAIVPLDPQVHRSVVHFEVSVSAVALTSLLYYLLYLYTGRLDWWRPLLLVFFAYLFLLGHFVAALGFAGVRVEQWSMDLVFGLPSPDDPRVPLVALLFVGPHMVLSLAYLAFTLRLRDPTLRYRVVMVAGSLVLFFSSLLLSILAGLLEGDAWQVPSRVLGLAAAVGVLLAYDPPAALRRRFGISSLDDPLADDGP